MAELSPRQFAKHKERANRIAKSIMVNGEWINPDPGVEKAKMQKTRNWHASLAPMKETLKSANITWPAFRNHINAHPDAPGGKNNNLYWAMDMHDEDPKNFIQNIGLK